MSDDIDYVGWKTVKWFLILGFLVAVVSGIGWCAHTIFYPVDQAQQVVERTLNADNVIYNYEWFHRQLGDYEAAGTNLISKQQELDQFLSEVGPRGSWTLATQQEENQLHIELSGLRALRTNLAHEYNAHVGMVNRNLFRERSLPDHLSDN